MIASKVVSQEHRDSVILALARFLCSHEVGVPCGRCLVKAEGGVHKLMGATGIEVRNPAMNAESFFEDILQRAGVDIKELERALTHAEQVTRSRPRSRRSKVTA